MNLLRLFEKSARTELVNAVFRANWVNLIPYLKSWILRVNLTYKVWKEVEKIFFFRNFIQEQIWYRVERELEVLSNLANIVLI
jgi:hypothetical protein